MKTHYLFITLCFILLPVILSVDPEQDQDAEVEGKAFMEKYDALSAKMHNKNSIKEWNYQSNITEYNKEEKLKSAVEWGNFVKEYWLKTIQFPWTSFHDPDLRRQFKLSTILGTAALKEDKYKRWNDLVSTMETTYAKAKICDYKNSSNCELSLDPELTHIFASSRDPDELKYYWVEWRKASGKKCRSLYQEYVELSNEASRLNNFTDTADYWIDDFESKEFEEDVQKLWNEVEPLYMELHAYVRRRLREVYGENVVPKKGAIPAHLLGNMWAQDWANIYDITVPYPDKPSLDVTEKLHSQGYTPHKMFKLSEEFYTSLNLSAMPDLFWKNSIIEKPKDRELICHASAWDFYDGKDFRIKMCTTVTMEDLITIHHEMGHIQYYLQYKDLPTIYRTGANSGFHEAVGDTIALSVRTTNHLRKVGLLDSNVEDDPQSDINFLYLSGLEKIAFLPFGYLIDVWRWGVFRGEITPENYNCQWWNLRRRLQGLEPPEHRSEEDFDPAAKYHTVADVPYIRYFVSFIIQFQFHRALCIKSGQFDPANPSAKPLHQCDIYQSVEAGNAFGNMLQMGASKHWSIAMEALTGQTKMDASPLMEYFAPLYQWLKEENKRNGEEVGWKTHPPQKRCVKSLAEIENNEKSASEDATTAGAISA
ncbi:angiotensin-converting enzyme-like isoform X2 [Lycorma delicatula]|uniref:angiotensin-converting enzyme-like isoform X2 n=1 Tax=Lycorma delicatula TaxID=130591 RepID=UPI003F51AB30